MHKGRLEAFSDGVLAVIITIMVLEMKTPQGTDWAALRPLLPTFIGYVLSFIYIGIYWTNHHHLLQAAQKVNGRILWANLHLLFWLSLVPFLTSWIGTHAFAPLAVGLYGGVLFMAAIAYTILVRTLVHHHGHASTLARAIGRDAKGYVSLALYAAGVVLAYWFPLASFTLYAAVAAIWLIPDRRIERALQSAHGD